MRSREHSIRPEAELAACVYPADKPRTYNCPMRKIGVALALSFMACSNETLPSFDAFGLVVGSGKNDLWWMTTQPGDDPNHPDPIVIHRADGIDRTIALDKKMKANHAFASAGPGTLWVLSFTDPRTPVMVRIDGTGAVLEDRSEDFEVFEPGSIYSATTLRAANGGVFLQMRTTNGPLNFRYDGEKFAPLQPPEALGNIFLFTARGPDEAWFTHDSGALIHYKAGDWTDVANSNATNFLSFDDAGAAYALGSIVVEYEGPYVNDIPSNAFVSVQKIQDDVAKMFRLKLELDTEPGYGFNVFGVVARAGGKFTVLGGMQKGGPFTFESWVVARNGDANGLATTDTTLHYYGDTCIDRCQSKGVIINMLDDGTFLLDGGVRTDHGGATQVLVGGAGDLP